MGARRSPGTKRREVLFLLACLAAAAVCAGLAFWFTVPLRAEETRIVPDTQALTGYVQVDLNTADAAALETLPGVGARKAQAILAYRAEHGPFAQVEDVLQMPGITRAIVDSWGAQAVVR